MDKPIKGLYGSALGTPLAMWSSVHHVYIYIYNIYIKYKFCTTYVTYGPHKAVAEVSNHNEPIGRKSGMQLVRKIRKSMDFTFSCFVLN